MSTINLYFSNYDLFIHLFSPVFPSFDLVSPWIGSCSAWVPLNQSNDQWIVVLKSIIKSIIGLIIGIPSGFLNICWIPFHSPLPHRWQDSIGWLRFCYLTAVTKCEVSQVLLSSYTAEENYLFHKWLVQIAEWGFEPASSHLDLYF